MQEGGFALFDGCENGSSATLRRMRGDNGEKRRGNIVVAADFHSQAQFA